MVMDSGLVLDKEDTGEGCDLAGDTEDDCGGDVGLSLLLTDSVLLMLLLLLLLLISFIMCSCSLALVSAFFSHSSCSMSCWVRGLVTLNLRSCCRIRGSSSGLHIFHLSRLLPFPSCSEEIVLSCYYETF